MSVVGIFSKSRPDIGGLYFDALLEESSELITDVTEYPIETGAIGNDHAVDRPLRLTMTVALSDNLFKSALAHDSIPQDWKSAASKMGPVVGTAVGATFGMLGGAAAAMRGIGGSVMTELAGSLGSRSSKMIAAIRALQQSHALIDVVGAKETYTNVLITNTRVQVTKENEGGLEMVVEMQKLYIVNSLANQAIVNSNLPAGDTAATQAQTENDLGEKGLQ